MLGAKCPHTLQYSKLVRIPSFITRKRITHWHNEKRDLVPQCVFPGLNEGKKLNACDARAVSNLYVSMLKSKIHKMHEFFRGVVLQWASLRVRTTVQR